MQDYQDIRRAAALVRGKVLRSVTLLTQISHDCTYLNSNGCASLLYTVHLQQLYALMYKYKYFPQANVSALVQ